MLRHRKAKMVATLSSAAATSLLDIAVAITYTSSGFTSLRTARERFASPIIRMSRMSSPRVE